MNEQDLDRIIDTAAAEMIAREPTRALRGAVMARVRESEPITPRRFVWAAGGLGAAACLVIALVVMESTPPPTVQVQAPAPAPLVMVEPPTVTDRQSAAALESVTLVAQSGLRRVQRPALAPNDLPSSIEPITAEPLVLPAIDLPPLENHAASVEQIEIDALTIEPLTASND